MELSSLRRLAIPSVCFLIAFLSYGSQFVFYYLQPGLLSTGEAWLFNATIVAIWLSYERACRVNPGFLPPGLQEEGDEDARKSIYVRWCKKCNAPKPMRAHHCKQCQRCIPKMDHHCPWTSNCVSATVFPHFLRFVFWASTALIILDYHLYRRGYAIYEQRDLPSYLGPPVAALVLLGLLILVANLTLFALSVLLVTSLYSLVINTTMIEQWEIERHEALVQKSKSMGGYVYAPGGAKLRIVQQEFPYDIGIWANIVQGMGSNNPLIWLLPFGGGPNNKDCWSFETNGFGDAGDIWPPVDPNRMARSFIRSTEPSDNHVGDILAFKSRQEADMKRWERPPGQEIRRQEISRATIVNADNEDVVNDAVTDDGYESEYEEGMDGEEGWTSRDGSRLKDFGVDEDDEDFAHNPGADDEDEEDNIPLAELIRRRRVRSIPL